jgi:transmembrane sensor
MLMKTNNFPIEDFILNESFQHYTLRPSPDNMDYWEAWIKEHPEAKETIEKSREIITFIAARKVLPKYQSLSDEVFAKLQQQINEEKKQNSGILRKIRFRHYWYAASLMIIIGLAATLRYYHGLFTSPVTVNRDLEIIVPDGQRSQLLLPDGTRVWLNSGSTFKYPAEFLKQYREVYIEGEAFFKVARLQGKPFIVHMKENLSIKVLGTEFDVKCYSNDRIIETTLVKGSIKLTKTDNHNQITRELDLMPNEKATYEKVSGDLNIIDLSGIREKNKNITSLPVEKKMNQQENIELITAWKDDALVFHDETFEEIGIKMERWFGLKINIKDENLKTERFTGKFVNNETIYQILDIINRSEPILYSTKNKEITITKKIKNMNH